MQMRNLGVSYVWEDDCKKHRLRKGHFSTKLPEHRRAESPQGFGALRVPPDRGPSVWAVRLQVAQPLKGGVKRAPRERRASVHWPHGFRHGWWARC